eukprot:4277805-Pyramimonas_sp.AAC.1
MNVEFLEKCLQKLSRSVLSTLTRRRSSARLPAVTRFTVQRRRQSGAFALCSPGFERHQVTCVVELFVFDELEEFRRGVEPVGRPDQKGQCDNF